MKTSTFLLLLPMGLTFIFLVVGWFETKLIFAAMAGRSVPRNFRRNFVFISLFVLGMLYIIVLQDQLGAVFRWHPVWIPLIGVWGSLIGFVAWRASRSKTRPEVNRTS